MTQKGFIIFSAPEVTYMIDTNNNQLLTIIAHMVKQHGCKLKISILKKNAQY